MTTSTKTNTGKVYVTFVDQWLDTLPAADSEDFREFADVTPSIIEIWVYSGILGYSGTFNDLSRWVKMKYKKLNRAFVDLLDEFKIVSYCYLNPHDEDTIDTIVLRINDTIQFYESQEVDDKKMDRLEAIQEEMDEHADEMAQEGGDMDYNERMQNMMEQHFDDGALGGDLDLGS